MPHIMIVTSPYYSDIAAFLMEGTTGALDALDATYEVVEAAGALEIPLTIKLGIERSDKPFDAYIALGCVIRGETSHYDIVCNESARGLSELSLQYNAPIGNAILTCNSMAQAIMRADPAQKNKGADAVKAVIMLLDIKKQFKIK
tara:strand:- start:30 stop:464 length:435 start_codon:yes stop_codon:yes gene_type:complete